MQLFRRFTDWLLYTSFFASLCAVALCMGTERLILGFLPPFTSLHVFIMGCTMMVYNAHYLIRKALPQISDRFRWTTKHRLWHVVIFTLGCCLSGIAIFFLNAKIFTACAVLGILSFAYTLPMLPLPGRLRLREFGWIKILVLTLVWTIVTSILPMLFWNKPLSDYPFEILIRFVFLFILCIAFDIRDMQTDLQANIHTLPNRIGLRNSYRVIDISILFFIVLSLVQYVRYPSYGRLSGELLTALFTKWAVVYAKKHASDKAYLGIVDGMMLLYGCLIAFFGHYK